MNTTATITRATATDTVSHPTSTAPDRTGRADTTDFAAVHTCLRRGGRALAIAVRDVYTTDRTRIDALQKYWRGYSREILLHHTVEDEIFYAALAERSSAARAHLARISADHHLLDELMAHTQQAMTSLSANTLEAAMLLDQLDGTMQRHLDFEDAMLVPLFAEHFTSDEYATLTARAMKSASVRAAAFSVPFLATFASPEQVRHLFGDAPLPVRLLLTLTRRSHANLTATALGSAAQSGTAPASSAIAERANEIHQ